MTQSVDVMQGTLNLLILKALSVAPMHAWGISDRVEQMSRGAFKIGQGSLYPAVHRLENRGWVTSHWHTTENNRIARYYQLTTDGRRAMDAELTAWQFYADAMRFVCEAE
jgi:transcriptional regulator